MTTQDTTTGQGDQGGDQDTPLTKQLRKQITEQGAHIADLKAKLVGQGFAHLGIDTTKGIGATMRRTFEADADADVDKLADWLAENFEWKPTAPNGNGQTPPEGQAPPAGELTPEQQAAALITERASQADAVTAVSQSQPGGILDALQQAAKVEAEKGVGPESISAKVDVIRDKIR